MEHPLKQNTTKGVNPFSRDRLFMVPRDEAAKGAMALLTVIQDEQPEIALASVAMLFAAWVKRLRVSPHEAYQLGNKLVVPQEFHQKGNIQAEVLRDFAGMRLMGDKSVELS